MEVSNFEVYNSDNYKRIRLLQAGIIALTTLLFIILISQKSRAFYNLYVWAFFFSKLFLVY